MATILKSTTLTVTLSDWETKPAAAVTVTVNAPRVAELTVKVEVAEVPSATDVGLSDVEGPAGDTSVVSETVPVNPAKLVTVIVDVAEEPSGIVRVLGLADILNSTTWTVTLTEWETPPLVPVTTTAKLPETVV